MSRIQKQDGFFLAMFCTHSDIRGNLYFGSFDLALIFELNLFLLHIKGTLCHFHFWLTTALYFPCPGAKPALPDNTVVHRKHYSTKTMTKVSGLNSSQ